MIYKITSRESVNVSYLMGTIHINDKEVIDTLGSAKKLIEKCANYAGEMNLGIVDQAEAQKAMKINDTRFLVQNYFSDSKIEKIEFVLEKYFKVDLSTLQDYYPIIVQNNLLKLKLKNDHPLGMDHELYHHAINCNKIIHGLETPQEQYSYLTRMDLKIQWQYFYQFIRLPNKHIQQIHSMKKNYVEGRSNQLYRQVYRSMGAFRRVMLTERNELMTARLIEKIDGTTIFATVGAGHLFGNSGMIALLKKKGYKVEKYKR
jgi:uncharacterized protein